MGGVEVRLGVVTDSHFSPAGTPPGHWHNPLHYDRAEGLLRRALDFLGERDVDAIAMLGDLTDASDEASIARAVTVLSTSGVPVFVVPGNHDCRLGVAAFRGHIDRLGATRVAMAGVRHDLAGLCVAGLTDLAPDEQRVLVIGDVPDSGWSDDPLVLLTHFPLLDRSAETLAAGLKYAGGFRDGGVLRRLYERHGPAIVLHGHLHIRDTTADRNVLQIGCAALIEPPHEATVVEIDTMDGGCRVRVVHASLEASNVATMPVMAPPDSDWTFEGGRWAATNAAT